MRLPAVPGQAGDRAAERDPVLPRLRQVHPRNTGTYLYNIQGPDSQYHIFFGILCYPDPEV